MNNNYKNNASIIFKSQYLMAFKILFTYKLCIDFVHKPKTTGLLPIGTQVLNLYDEIIYII